MALVSTERISDAASLVLNSCGENRVEHLRRGCVRPFGRVDVHILYIVRGACHVVLSGGETIVPAGRFILFRPGERQEYFFEADSGSFSYYIHFTGRDAEAVLRSLGLWDITVGIAPNSRELEWLFSQMIREYSLSQAAHETVSGGLLLSILGLLARGVELSRSQIDEKKQMRVQRAIERMYADMDKKLSIEALARECNYSVGYFSHLFRAVTGVSAHAYMCRLRIERAKNMLDSTDLSVLEIALAVGCEDQNYFSRFFKEQTGLSPTAYRASRKG
jgi:AraC-like DNA-binding protein